MKAGEWVREISLSYFYTYDILKCQTQSKGDTQLKIFLQLLTEWNLRSMMLSALFITMIRKVEKGNVTSRFHNLLHNSSWEHCS